MKKINFSLAFGGFYESQENNYIDREIENYLQYNEKKEDDIRYKINYEEIARDICEVVYLEFIYNALNVNIDFKFKGLSMPQYYNFDTDIITSEISLFELRQLLQAVYKEDGRENVLNWIDKASRTKSGFISFYDGIREVKKDLIIFTQYLFKYIFNKYYDDYLLALEQCNFYEIVANSIEYTDEKGA